MSSIENQKSLSELIKMNVTYYVPIVFYATHITIGINEDHELQTMRLTIKNKNNVINTEKFIFYLEEVEENDKFYNKVRIYPSNKYFGIFDEDEDELKELNDELKVIIETIFERLEKEEFFL